MNMRPRIETVMLVDDEAFDQRNFSRILERSGRFGTIVGFLYPDAALDYLRKAERPEIDVLFLDINMPRLSGFEFLDAATQEFGRDFAKTVVIMLTTSLDPKDAARAAEFEVVKDYIKKPLHQDHIDQICMLLPDGPPP